MESQVFDVVRSEKEKAIARFNCLRRVARLRQIFEVVAVLAVISWSSSSVLKTAAAYCLECSAYLLNHHVVFLIGNAIIVLLFVLCRRSDAGGLSAGGGDFYDDYVKHSEAVHHRDPPPPCPIPDAIDGTDFAVDGGCADEEKQIVVCPEMADDDKEIPHCDDVSAAIEEATRQIKKFKRTQSEKLRREIAAKPASQLRRSETQNRRGTAGSDDQLDTSEIELLSSEEFRRTIEAFIDKYWSKKKKAKETQLVRMA